MCVCVRACSKSEEGYCQSDLSPSSGSRCDTCVCVWACSKSEEGAARVAKKEEGYCQSDLQPFWVQVCVCVCACLFQIGGYRCDMCVCVQPKDPLRSKRYRNPSEHTHNFFEPVSTQTGLKVCVNGRVQHTRSNAATFILIGPL